MEKQLRWPVWMNYAVDVRNKIDALPAKKSFEKSRDRVVWDTYSIARQKGYQGTLEDWDYLVLNVGKPQKMFGRYRTCFEALSTVKRRKPEPMQ